MIDEYLREFDRWLIGSGDEKAEWRAELSAHLHEAREAGDLEGALDRFGSPRVAAATFRAGRPLAPAPGRRRWKAAAIDHLPLLVVSVIVAIQEIARGHDIVISIPAAIVIDDSKSWANNLGVPLAVAWSWLGLAWLEARGGGRTPGKALLGLRTVGDDGTLLTRGQAVGRRWGVLFGPLVWIDFVVALATERHQRLLDLFAHTLVVEDPRP